MVDRSLVAAADVRAALARAPGRKKLDLIFDAPDPGALVRSLPAEDLYLAIQEIGTADSSGLVQLASPEQFRTFVDLDAWHGDAVDPESILLWLRLARGDGGNEYKEKLALLDMEVLEILIRSLVHIFDLEEEGEPPDDLEGTVERTPEGRFLLVYPSAGAEYGAARRVIDDLYAEDPFRAGRLLYAVRWELETDLSEEAYRWRNARLADLGFPSPEEAASLYAKVDLAAALPPPAAPIDAPPGFFLATLEAGSLLDRAMARVPDDARDTVESQLVALINMALVANRVELSDLVRVRAEAEEVRDGLSVGLEHLAGADETRAAAILAGTALKRIFQVGFTRGLELGWKAKRLAAALPLKLHGATAQLPDDPDGAALEALLARRPRFAEALLGTRPIRATTPTAALLPAPVRPFARLAELDLAAAAVGRVRVLGELFAEAGLDAHAAADAVREAEGEVGLVRVRYSDLFLTAAVRATVGLPFSFAALPAAKLDDAVAAAFSPDGRLRADFRDAALASFAAVGARRTPAHEAAARALAAAALARLEEELGPQVVAGGVHPAVAAPLIVAA